MNCSGTNAYRYGTMKAWVIAVTVVLADGSIVKTRQRPRKSAVGYDLTSLIVGSEGTLGLVTEAVLKVTSAPLNLHVAVARFPSTQEATRTVISCIRSGLPIDALELIDKPSMAAINCSGFSSRQWEETPTLFLKFSGSLQTVQSQIYFVQEAAKSNQCNSFEVTAEKDQIEVIWGARKCVAKALNAMRKDPTDLFLHADAAVPISKLAVMMEEAFKVVTDAGLFCSCVGHVGDGKQSPSSNALSCDA
jgi:FAD/FMN-containing dehydrogenase